MSDPAADALFAEWLAWCDAAYGAFCGEPFRTQEESDEAYAFKCGRTDALCRLRARVEALGYAGVAEYHAHRLI